ncbi:MULTISPECIES: DUF883 family protein [Tepidiphilus]|jgi:ElaB/YqjD/DUF883 family membrane-anchored ribosome-binding protein|uniref:Membrane-anchored ribosome-binding protein, inhibits growth in stationary phase, ElaB/YqjD/DUF883 family n=1 Tax=Tepidiphilus thermophilus TaxID=876478 RepID=A0A0K6ITN1_9PROT|nr:MULTISPECIES: DUF883 family protein [Tepidiphilus]CUB06434.1 Membrane-anchored ribosome-binding protein, inhibits growth in stationary phase, ElaB/YqjD/DUF883 family [Tepidiphilus thermophilus]
MNEQNVQTQPTPTPQASAEKLKEDLRHLAQTLEELVAATAGETSSEIRELRERARTRLEETRARLAERGTEFYQQASTTLRATAQQTEGYVREHPWTSIGLGAAVGMLIGLLMGRR